MCAACARPKQAPFRRRVKLRRLICMSFLPSASLAHLRLRAELLARVRAFFTQRDFLEVETPILSADVTVDRHLDPLSTILPDDPRRPEAGRRLWLQTSPEFGMKRLLAAGATAIFQITRRLSRRGNRSAAQSGIHDGRVVSSRRRHGCGNGVALRLVRRAVGHAARPNG